MRKYIQKINIENIFLIDGIGALLSAFSLAVTLPILNQFVGMDLGTLHLLAGIAALFAVYSLFCHFVLAIKKPVFLLTILIANTSYTILTATIVANKLNQITAVGIAYFIFEIIIILFLVKIEFDIFRSINSVAPRAK